MAGFFAGTKKPPTPTIPRCGACGRKKTHKPHTHLEGEGERGILIVESVAGEDNPTLKKALRKLGISMERDCWRTGAVLCGDSEPNSDQIRSCYPSLKKVISLRKPQVIILTGAEALESVLGDIWKEKPGSIDKWAGHTIPWKKWGCWICPIHSSEAVEKEHYPAMRKKWTLDLSRIVGKLDEPLPEHSWEKPEVIFNSLQASRMLKDFYRNPAPIAFDYETNMLKPDSEKARIVTCSVCHAGRYTIAFPWEGEVIPIMKKLLKSDRHPKIASNLKFEERWTKAVLGFSVSGWMWDTMLAAHILDNRTGVTSIKFQSFVQLGFGSYTSSVDGFLNADNGNTENRIKECDLGELLLYNGWDSLLEYQVAIRQMAELGFTE